MKILITGVAGFIGYHAANRLLIDGHEVIGIDNMTDNGDIELKHARMAQLGVSSYGSSNGSILRSNEHCFTFIHADILDKDALREICQRERFHTIIHLAASTGIKHSNEDPELFVLNNVVGTENVLEAARNTGVQHFFFSSSAAVHGPRAQAPFSEEDDVDTPMSIYGGTKRMCELLCYTYSQCYNLPVTVFRFFTAYGPWARPDSVPMKVAHDIIAGRTIQVINNGYLVRDFTYVDDIMDGMISALNNPCYATGAVAPYSLYNIGHAKPVPFLAFVQSIENSLGVPASIETTPASPNSYGESTEMYADTTKLTTELAYSPVWDYTEGVPMFTQWFREYYKDGIN